MLREALQLLIERHRAHRKEDLIRLESNFKGSEEGTRIRRRR